MLSSPYYQFLLVMPNGNARGVNDLDLAKAKINMYYQQQMEIKSHSDSYQDVTEMAGRVRNALCQQIGVAEGEARVYDLADLIEKLRDRLVFDEDREEIISKLLERDINVNLYKYGIDDILCDVEIVQMIEPYGEQFSEL